MTLECKQAVVAFNIQWDLMSHITKFAGDLDKQQKLCRDIGVPVADATKIQYHIESIYTSDMFNDKEMQAWEVKPTEDKTGMPPKHNLSCSSRAKKNSMQSISHAPKDMRVPIAL